MGQFIALTDLPHMLHFRDYDNQKPEEGKTEQVIKNALYHSGSGVQLPSSFESSQDNRLERNPRWSKHKSLERQETFQGTKSYYEDLSPPFEMTVPGKSW